MTPFSFITRTCQALCFGLFLSCGLAAAQSIAAGANEPSTAPKANTATAPADASVGEFGVSLKIRNTSIFPVRIDLPGVMQANFLPFSESSASVSPGQALYFNYRGKRTLLGRVTTRERSQVIVINEWVAQRSAELAQSSEADAPRD
jgi:hypothetical protein